MVRTVYLLIMVLVNYIIITLIPVKSKNKLFLNVSFIELFVILILREPVSDMITYVDMFHYTDTLSFSEIIGPRYFEDGYMIFTKIITFLTTNERFFIVITSFIILFGQYMFIKKYSSNYLISMYIFIGLNFFDNDYILIRQGIALAILMFSIRYIEDKKLFKFIMCIVVATLFHQSALIFVLLYFISKIKCTKTIKMCCIPIFAIIFMLRQFIMNIIYGFTYSNYIGRVQGSDGYTMLFLFIGIYILIVFSETIMQNKEQKEEISVTENIFYWMYILAVVFQILSTAQSIVARLVLYFSISLIILIPNTIQKFENKRLSLLSNILIIILLLGYSYIVQPQEIYQIGI